MNQASIFSAADLKVGLHAEFEREITLETIESFSSLSGDWNPLHTNASYAASTNYGARIAQGAFQVALASAMAGMHLPGREVVVSSFICRFPSPLLYPCTVRVQGEVIAWTPRSAAGTLRVRVVELSRNTLTAEIHVGFSLHERRFARNEENAPEEDVSSGPKPADPRPTVLLTGSGGLGSYLATVLSRSYNVVHLARSRPPSSHNANHEEWILSDLTASDWELLVERHLDGRKLFAVIHTAWPGSPRGGLLDVDCSTIRMQTDFAALITIRMARFLRANAQGAARFVILGSTAGTLKPVLNMAAYSLGKAALEHTVRLLAPELARSGITINLVTPSFVPTGMNASKTNRTVLLETAKVPLGKLCSPDDVASAVEFFLSPGAAFVSGQTLPLTGAQL
jgi:3-oxoacyl-[acyl-carrier protein] reductase